MADRIPPPAENQALVGPRQQSLYGSFLALALHGAAIMRAPAKLRFIARWLSADPRPSPDGAGQVLEGPPRRVPVLLDTEQLAALAADLRVAIVDGERSVPSITQRRADSSDSDSDSSGDDEGGHPSDQHLWYPLIQSLEVGDARLFFLSGSAGSVPGLPDARQGDGVSRLSDVHENTWILKAGTETFPVPSELTNETTRTWVLRLKITTILVCLSKQQLDEQNRELSEEVKEQCFAEVAEQSLKQLLEVACSLSDARWSDVCISQQLTVFDTLVDVLFNILDLRFSRSGEVAGIVNKMVTAFKGLIQRTSKGIHGRAESTIHPATFVLIQVLQFFCRNREMVQSILDSGDYNTGPCSDIFDCFLSKLKDVAEIVFQEKGQRCIFILNNIYYVFQKNCHPGLLPPNLVSTLDSLIDQYKRSYLNEYWFPLTLSYLEGVSLKKARRSSLEIFVEEFFRVCDSQMTWKVQTVLKGILRKEIVDLIVPKYVTFLEALQERPSSGWPPWLKGMQRARSEKPMYTGPQMELAIRKLFER